MARLPRLARVVLVPSAVLLLSVVGADAVRARNAPAVAHLNSANLMQCFNNTSLSGEPALTRYDQAVDYAWGTGSPGPTVDVDRFSCRWTKTVFFAAGDYAFTVVADDGVRLYIDGQLLIDKWIDQSPVPVTVTTSLIGGNHTVVMEYYEAGGEAQVGLAYSKSDSGEYLAQYFDNRELRGLPALTRSESVLVHDWGFGSPAEVIPTDGFSARWTKTASFAAGEYAFTVVADDGARLYIDGQLLVDKWIDQSPAPVTVTKSLTGGTHTIVVEYYEAGGEAQIGLSYTAFNLGEYVAQYYDNRELRGLPALTRSESVLIHNWGFGSPAEVIPTDGFSARWTKTTDFVAGEYAFTVVADDGMRLHIDGQLLVDKWFDQSPAPVTIAKFLTGGTHTIVVEYYEAGGEAQVGLVYSKFSRGEYLAQYYDNRELRGLPALTRSEDVLIHNWGFDSPADVIPTDGFSARWTKTTDFVAGDYAFTIVADDGVRLYIDGQLLVDKWIDQSPVAVTVTVTVTVTKSLAGGTHTIVVEYYEAGGEAQVGLVYSKFSRGEYLAQYYDNRELRGLPTLTRSENVLVHNWGFSSPADSIRTDGFSARWTKTTALAAGSYAFTVVADDGVRFYIDGQLLVDKWVDQSPVPITVTKSLTSGNHTIVVEYYEAGGEAQVGLAYSKFNPGDYLAQYYDNRELRGLPALTRSESVLIHNWGFSSPADVIPTDGFSARWTKTETFIAGDYAFTAMADDGVRLYIDGQLLVDKWIDQSPVPVTVTKTLTGGSHTIIMEYYEAGGEALAQLSYQQT